ncbi:hypothetical protein ACQKFK_29700 [Bacillus mycoides]|uniref:hypothetical protein n=1 Tax=Bacillus mycoides TaxID=1405 RepID=UPI003D06A5F6
MKKKNIIFIFIFIVALILIICRYNQLNTLVKTVSFQTIEVKKGQEIKVKNGMNLNIEKVSQFKKDGLDYCRVLISAVNESNSKIEINTNNIYLSDNFFSTSFLTGVNSLQDNEEIKFGTRIYLEPQQTGKYELTAPILPKFFNNKEKVKDIYFNYKVKEGKSNSILEYKIKL